MIPTYILNASVDDSFGLIFFFNVVKEERISVIFDVDTILGERDRYNIFLNAIKDVG